MHIFVHLVFLLLSCSVVLPVISQCEKKAIFIFVHGIFDSSCQSEQYGNIIDDAIMISFDFDDALLLPFIYRPFFSSLGQENEIAKLNQVYESIIAVFHDQCYPVPPIVLVGVSRGASVILNFLATKQPQHVVAAICESPFDSIQNIAAHTASYYLPQRLQKVGERLFFFCFFKHDSQGINPLCGVADINPKIPILLISSKEDVRVPSESTERLYWVMKKNKKNVWIKIFEHGQHAKILKTNKIEYKSIMDNFLSDNLYS